MTSWLQYHNRYEVFLQEDYITQPSRWHYRRPRRCRSFEIYEEGEYASVCLPPRRVPRGRSYRGLVRNRIWECGDKLDLLTYCNRHRRHGGKHAFEWEG
jgi:hypothetical protein